MFENQGKICKEKSPVEFLKVASPTKNVSLLNTKKICINLRVIIVNILYFLLLTRCSQPPWDLNSTKEAHAASKKCNNLFHLKYKE